MEFWSYAPEGGGFLITDDNDLAVDAFGRSRKAPPGCNFKASYDLEAVESMDFMDLSLADMTRRPFHGNTPMEMPFGEVGYDSSKPVASPSCPVTFESCFGEEESISRHTSSLMESNSQDSSLSDLKLGRVADYENAKDSKVLQERSVASSAQPHSQAKRARVVSLYSQTPYCQVHGCNMDLSSSKDYHKRHRVCDVHSKTAKVIVNGIEQRFCQQCSRFHLLAEFDNGKRSCRKRLAGHNERRRKLPLNTLSGKRHKLLQSYHGIEGSSIYNMRHVSRWTLYHEIYGQANQCKRVEPEEEFLFNPMATVLISDNKLLLKCFLQMQEKGKPYLGIPSLLAEEYNVSNAACNVQEFTGSSSCNRALSLLSDQSQNSLSRIAEQLGKRSVNDQDSCFNNSVGKPLWFGSLERHSGNGFSSHGMNSIGIGQAAFFFVSNVGNAIGFDMGTDAYFQESDHLGTSSLYPERASTIDLLQLSSHLRRVEQQRNFMQLKLQN